MRLRTDLNDGASSMIQSIGATERCIANIHAQVVRSPHLTRPSLSIPPPQDNILHLPMFLPYPQRRAKTLPRSDVYDGWYSSGETT